MSEFFSRKFKPVSEKVMLAGGPEETICGVLREIYLNSKEEDTKLLCRLATAMAKSMGKAIAEYKRNENITSG